MVLGHSEYIPKRILKICLKEGHLEELKKHAENGQPYEACAILLGNFRGDNVVVTDVILTANADRSPVAFTVDANELVSAYLKADREGKDVVAIFHSHPAQPFPSSLDIKFMKLNPVVWLILSLPGGSYRAYQWFGDRPELVSVEIEK